MSTAIYPEHLVEEDRQVEKEKKSILAERRKDPLLPDAQEQLTLHICAFLFVVFFPLGLVLYYYGKIFGHNLRVAGTVLAMWWLNFTIVFFLMP